MADAGADVRRLTLDSAGTVTGNDHLATGFSIPQGVVESGGNVLFSDSSGAIWQIQTTTSIPITHPATAQQLAVGAIVPGNQGSVAADSAGALYVSNFGGTIKRVDPTGATAATVVDISPPTSCDASQSGGIAVPSFRGLAFSPNGDLVATGFCKDNIYIFPATDISNALSSGTPISTLPAPFAENPSGALDSPDFNGPFGLVFWTSDATPPSLEGRNIPFEGDNVIYVDVNGPTGTPDGTPAMPYLKIQDAVDAAGPGDIIKVRGGNYPENVVISKSDLYLVGRQPGALAVIDASPAGLSGITIQQNVKNVSIENFRFTKAVSEGTGYVSGIIIYGGSEGRGIEICNNVFNANDAGVATQNTSPLIINNTFVQNSDGGVTAASSSDAIVRNNIFQENGDGIRSSAAITIDFNLFYNNSSDFGGSATCTTADGCVFGADPLLANVSGHNYHLLSGSPAIDAGTSSGAPDEDFDFEGRPVDGDSDGTPEIDIGADEASGASSPPPSSYTIEQDGFQWFVRPLQGTKNIVDFYSYSKPDGASANTDPPLARSDTSVLFLYRDGRDVSLVMIHDKAKDTGGGQVDFSFSGVPQGTSFVVRDDPNRPGEAELPISSWGWGACCTDGGALGGSLNGAFKITITPDFIGGINDWKFLSEHIEAPRSIGLDMSKPITIEATPFTGRARLVNMDDPDHDLGRPETPLIIPSVGGTGDIELLVQLPEVLPCDSCQERGHATVVRLAQEALALRRKMLHTGICR